MLDRRGKCEYLDIPIYKEEGREGGKYESILVGDQIIYSSPISLRKRKNRRKGGRERYIDSFYVF